MRGKQSKSREIGLLLILGLLASGVLFRHLISCGFEESLVNILDGRLLVGIAEHWFKFYCGEVSWRDMLFFYPNQGTLGYSDALFLFGIPYSVFRALGMELYNSWDLTIILFSFVGYTSMYMLLRSVCRVSISVAHVCAVFFIIGAPMYTILSNSHHQLYTVWLIPLLIHCLFKALQFDNGIRIKSNKWWILSCGLYGCIACTSFYIFWCFSLIAAVAAVLWIALCRFERASKHGAIGKVLHFPSIDPDDLDRLTTTVLKWFLATVILLISMVPLLLTYLPVINETKFIHFGIYKEMQPGFSDYLTPGVHNLLYGEFIRASGFQIKQYSWELSYGIPVGFLLFCFAAYFIQRTQSPNNPESKNVQRVLLTLIGTVLVISLIIFRVSDFSLWDIVRKMIPGAFAIRAVFRINVLLYTGLLIVAGMSWERTWHMWRGYTLRKVLVTLALLFVLAEQIGETRLLSRVNRKEESCGLALIKKPGEEIETFFLGGMSNKIPGQAGVTALRIGQILGIPSIEGSSGAIPIGFEMHKHQPGTPEYFDAVRRWIRQKKIHGLIGELNLEDNNWKIHPADSLMVPFRFYEPDKNILVQEGLNPNDFLQQGWSYIEPWGVWSVAGKSVIAIPVREVPEKGFTLELSLRAFLPEKGRKVSTVISIAGEEVMKVNFTRKNRNVKVSLFVDAKQFNYNTLEILFQSKGNSSPKDYGISEDKRPLGIGISSCSLNKIQ